MPAVFSEILKSEIVTSTMTTINNRTDSAMAYSTSTSNSPHINNSISTSGTSVKQENSPPTKYIQLQTVRPQAITGNTGLAASVATTTTIGTNALQVTAQSQQHTTLPGVTGIPPGISYITTY